MIAFLFVLLFIAGYVFIGGIVGQRWYSTARKRCAKDHDSGGYRNMCSRDHSGAAIAAGALWPFAFPLAWGMSLAARNDDK